jgi:hypothetical protein
LRSVTGDRGVEGLKEWWDDRFGKSGRDELKANAQELLRSSRAVIEKSKRELAEEAKKESLAVRVRATWGKHGRLIRAAIAVILLWTVASWGCSLLFDDDKPKRRAPAGAVAPGAKSGNAPQPAKPPKAAQPPPATSATAINGAPPAPGAAPVDGATPSAPAADGSAER